jgi:hypothetical protein
VLFAAGKPVAVTIDAIVPIPRRPVPAPTCVPGAPRRRQFVMELIGKGILCVILKLPERGHFMPQDFLFQICYLPWFIALQDIFEKNCFRSLGEVHWGH